MPEKLSFELVPTIKSDRFIDPLAHNAIIDSGIVPVEFEDTASSFFKPSNFHGRSFEDRAGHVTNVEDLVDEHKDSYEIITIKGASTARLYSDYSSIEPTMNRVNGLLDSLVFERAEKVSRHLRQAGVLTEWPIYFARPKYFPVKVTETANSEDYISHITVQRLRRLLGQRYENKILKDMESSDSQEVSVSIGQYGAALQGIAEFKPGILYRATLANIRLNELSSFDEAGIAEEAIATTILALQKRNPDHLDCIDEIMNLDANNEDDRVTYIIHVLPQIMGENLARLHNAGAYHHYPHSGNWTLAGEIIDLDSVMCGELFEDDKSAITIADRLREVSYVTSELLNLELEIDIISFMDMARKLTSSYFCERNLDDDITDVERIIIDYFFSEPPEYFDELTNPYILTFDDNQQREMMHSFLRLKLSAQLTDESLEEAGLQWRKLYTDEANRQVKEFFESNPTPNLPKWVKFETIAHNELLKVYAQYSRKFKL